MPSTVFANATQITVAAWFNLTTLQAWQAVFDVGIDAHISTPVSTGIRYMRLVLNSDNTLVFAITKDGYSNEQQLTASSALKQGTWKHVAVVLGPASAELYVDGAQVLSNSTMSLRPKDLGAIDYAWLGKSHFPTDPYFDGLLDEVRVYHRALSAAEIKELYQYAGP
jgi:hypothetical protein